MRVNGPTKFPAPRGTATTAGAYSESPYTTTPRIHAILAEILQDFAGIPFCRITLPVLGLGPDPWGFADSAPDRQFCLLIPVADVALLHGPKGTLPALVLNAGCAAMNLEIDSALCSGLSLSPC